MTKTSRALHVSLKTDLNNDNNFDNHKKISDEPIPPTDFNVRIDDAGSNRSIVAKQLR